MSKALVIEADQETRDAMVEALAKKGFQVDACVGMRAAETRLRENAGQYDVVLVDAAQRDTNFAWAMLGSVSNNIGFPMTPERLQRFMSPHATAILLCDGEEQRANVEREFALLPGASAILHSEWRQAISGMTPSKGQVAAATQPQISR